MDPLGTPSPIRGWTRERPKCSLRGPGLGLGHSGDGLSARDFRGGDAAPSFFPLPGVPKLGLIYRLENQTRFHHAGDGSAQSYRVLLPEGESVAICFQVNDPELADNVGTWTAVISEELVNQKCEPLERLSSVGAARTCDQPACATGTCSSDGQCCTQSCSGGRCASCIAAFGLCSRDENCCSCSCVAGRCR